ncbi:hypothetical protein HMPREF1556_00491 [Porphyromonas sp. oral taxon 278 str. W7784]|nr:hypothetical protein HMPREF1556_00491 [Porphyromonas sp. oral taxon 278 str. W7784]
MLGLGNALPFQPKRSPYYIWSRSPLRYELDTRSVSGKSLAFICPSRQGSFAP